MKYFDANSHPQKVSDKGAHLETHSAGFRVIPLDVVEGGQSVDLIGQTHSREVCLVISARSFTTFSVISALQRGLLKRYKYHQRSSGVEELCGSRGRHQPAFWFLWT